MSSVTDTGPAPPCPAPFNMAAHVLARARLHPDKTALIVAGQEAETWSYGELDAAVRGVMTGLGRLDLGAGDRVLLRLGDSVDFPIAYLAAIGADLVPVPTSAQLTVPEISVIAAEIGPGLIIAEPGIALPGDGAAPVLPVAALREMRDLPPGRFATGDPERPAYIVYTSGTAGRPRGVVHAHRAIWARRMMIDGWYGLGADDRVLHAGAFNWTYTLGTGLMDPWSVGATALIAAGATRPADLPAMLERHEVSVFAAAPGVYRQMLRRRSRLPLPALRHGLSAGEKLPDAVRSAWETATGTALHEAFGMSECSTFLSGCPARPAPPGTLGFAQPGRRIAILGADGPVPRGETGILAIGGEDPGLMLGYLGAEAETKARYRDDWFLTGDMMSMNADGALAYHGRADDMMNAGGHRVSPIEVETALTRHPAIHEAAAVEVTVRANTSVIAAFYVAETPLPEAELVGHCAGCLARYKTPRLFLRVDTLPKGANGKLLRRALRDRYEAEHG